MATPESAIKKAIKQILDSYKPDCWYFMPRGTTYGTAGVPDFVGVYLGRMFTIEAKARTNKLTALQELQMRKIRDAGGLTAVVNDTNISAVKDLLEGIRALQKDI